MRSGALPQLLAVGEGARPSGYARVLDALLPHLARRFRVHHLTLANPAPPPAEGYVRHGVADAFDRLGLARLPALLRSLSPDLVLAVHDPDYAAPLQEACRALPAPPRIVFYAPMDSVVHSPGTLAALAACDRVVAYTDHGRALLSGLFAGAGLSPARPLATLPHGVDRSLFRPLAPTRDAARKVARARLFRDRPGLDAAFVVLNGNRATRRKRLDITLEGFARFAHGAEAPAFLMLLAPRDVHTHEIDAQARRLGVEGRVLWVRGGDGALSDEQLNLAYNAADCGVNTSWSEGWGLVAFEHAAAAPAPQIMPDHSACGELWRGAAVLLSPREDVEWYAGRRVGGAPSAADLAAALSRLHLDPEERARLGARAHALAVSATFDWAAIAARFGALLDEALGSELGPAPEGAPVRSGTRSVRSCGPAPQVPRDQRRAWRFLLAGRPGGGRCPGFERRPVELGEALVGQFTVLG